MTGFGAGIAAHVVRRGLEHFPANTEFQDGGVVAFKGDGEKPALHIPPSAIIVGGLVFIVTMIICASIDYTIGSLMASLAMIESPSTITVLDPNPPAYTDEPDAPLNKNNTTITDIPVMELKAKPITGQATYKFLAHVRGIGGRFAVWRGLGQYIVYHIALNFLGHAVGSLFGMLIGRAGEIIGMTLAVIATLRLHTLWTHAMIGTPSSTPWYKRFVSRKQAKILLLPTLVYAVAMQLVVFVPLGVAMLLRLPELADYTKFSDKEHEISGVEVFTIILRILAVPLSAVIIALFVLLPASAALVRIEACLLPEEQETIVSFDKETIMGEVNVNERGSSRKIFAAAWKSFSRASRWRVVMVFFKSFIYQFVVAFLGCAIAISLFYVIARKDIKRFFNGHHDEIMGAINGI